MQKLPLELDNLTHKKLVLVRQLYQQAVLQAAPSHSIVSRIMAVLTFDLAAETLLKSAFNALKPDKTPSTRFEGIIQQVESAMGDTVPSRAKILHVHKIRNTAQHEARFPNLNDLDECRVYTRDFIEELSQLVWNVSFESVSLTDLVNNAVVKGFLVEAEAALGEQDWEKAVKKANAGLSWALHKARGRFVNEPYVMTPVDYSIDRLQSATRFDSWMGVNKPREINRELWEAIQSSNQKALRDVGVLLSELEEMIRAVEADTLRAQYAIIEFTLGIDRADYLRFRRVAGDVEFVDHEASEVRYSRMKSDIDHTEAEFVFNFCVASVLQIEAQAGDIELPFGVE